MCRCNVLNRIHIQSHIFSLSHQTKYQKKNQSIFQSLNFVYARTSIDHDDYEFDCDNDIKRSKKK